MKRVFILVLIWACLAGCSSNEEKKQEKEKTIRRGSNEQTYKQDKPPKKVVGLHDKALAEKGVVRDKNGNYGPGSIDKILGR